MLRKIKEFAYSKLRNNLLARKIVNTVWLSYCKLFRAFRTFTFDGRTYRYFYHAYNTAWKNERTVEIPIIWDIVQAYQGKNVLEVGNVLSHYFPVTHTIVDKYEHAPGVLNHDIVDYRTEHPYDLIITMSTLEHVGWDEDPRDPPKVLRAVENLLKCLAPGGTLVVTLPLGYNLEMDNYLRQGKLCFDRTFYLKRVSAGNDWIETGWNEVGSVRFDHPYRAANGLVIGMLKRRQ